MYRLKTEQSFDAAHFLAGYEGKCHNIHGHRWRVELEIQGRDLNKNGQERGMVTDFSVIKNAFKEIVGRFDHTLIVEEGSLSPELAGLLRTEGFSLTEVPFRPTAEEFARYFYDRMREMGFEAYSVTVYETPSNAAAYIKETEDKP